MTNDSEPYRRMVSTNGSVDADLGGFLQVFVVPDTIVESVECAVSLGQSVVDLFVKLCVRGNGAPQVGKLLD